jgi:hypothetical protein
MCETQLRYGRPFDPNKVKAVKLCDAEKAIVFKVFLPSGIESSFKVLSDKTCVRN